MIDFENGSVIKLRKDNRPRFEDLAPLLIPGEQVLGNYYGHAGLCGIHQ